MPTIKYKKKLSSNCREKIRDEVTGWFLQEEPGKGKEEKRMADTIDKFATHDFARIFAEDIKNYLDKGGSIDNLSATNVYNVLDGKSEEDIFVFTKNTIKMVLKLRTEGVRMSFLRSQIKLQEDGFALGKDALPEIRHQIAGDKDFGRWDEIEYARYFALLSNINIMSYRNVFKELGDRGQLFKDVYMMVDLMKEGVKNG